MRHGWFSNAGAGVASAGLPAIQRFLTAVETAAEGIAPPTADEWPELGVPDRPTAPPLDWKTPLIFFSSLITIAPCLLVVVLKLPFFIHLKTVTTFLQSRQTTAQPAERNIHGRKTSADLSSAMVSQDATPPAIEIAEMRQFVQSEGSDPGPADGKAGSKTQKALSEWARDAGSKILSFKKEVLELVRRRTAGRQVKQTPGTQLPTSASIPDWSSFPYVRKSVWLIDRAGGTIACPVEP